MPARYEGTPIFFLPDDAAFADADVFTLLVSLFSLLILIALYAAYAAAAMIAVYAFIAYATAAAPQSVIISLCCLHYMRCARTLRHC